MLPVIAIIGRPNVGKSTLFNYLIRARTALVADEKGVTRDRQYGEGSYEERPFIVIDTGGIEDATSEIQDLVRKQTWLAIEEADILFWLVDARSGLTADDRIIAEQLRSQGKTLYVLVNKSDGMQAEIACADFYQLGFPSLFPIAAAQGMGINHLLEQAFARLPVLEQQEPVLPKDAIKVAIVGRPNVGKSTLVNRILGEERVLVLDEPGTTRDSVYIPFERRGKSYVLIDTAGVRRKRSIDEALEKFSVVKTLQAIAAANVVIFVVDARLGLAEQDLHLLGYILESGRSLVIAINKWDSLPKDQRDTVTRAIDRRLQFLPKVRFHHISATQGTGVGDLFPSVQEAYRSAIKKVSASKLTTVLENAVEAHQPPTVAGRRIKLRFAHPGGYNPPVIVIHGNQVDKLPAAYRRYLGHYFEHALSLVGTPIRLEFKIGENPYQDKPNPLTERQVKRRKRLMTHVKARK